MKNTNNSETSREHSPRAMTGQELRYLISRAHQLQQAGNLHEAEKIYLVILSRHPNLVNAQINLAIIQEETGRFDEAVEHLRQIIRARPDVAQAHFRLAHMRNHASSAGEIDAMKWLFSKPETSTKDRIMLAFGLGSALDQNGSYQEAFGYFMAGHQFMKQTRPPFVLAEHEELTRHVIDTFDDKSVARFRQSGPGDELPIFILGMPRSGTTLAEQILASHPQIGGAGELDYVEDVVRQIIRITGKSFPECWNSLHRDKIYDLGLTYLDNLRSKCDGCIHITDTTPTNFFYAGLIATILPGARLVHCCRDPMDTCLSIFQQPLSESHHYAHDLASLGGYYKLYQELMSHWQKVFPGRIYNLDYETVTRDSESEIRKLLDFCNVPFHDNCLAFHQTDRAVLTPSATQVRQPMYTSSIGRWRRYESQLAPLKEILCDV